MLKITIETADRRGTWELDIRPEIAEAINEIMECDSVSDRMVRYMVDRLIPYLEVLQESAKIRKDIGRC